MGDGMTDARRESDRWECYLNYIRALIEFLKNPTKENKLCLVKAAKTTDAIRGGYFTRETGLRKCFEKTLKSLKANDKTAWAHLLNSVVFKRIYFQELKKLSPFKDQFVLIVDQFNNVEPTISGDLREFVLESVSAKMEHFHPWRNIFISIPVPEKGKAKFIKLQ
ncbi:MAG: hypothetical protein Q8N88_05060 [Nanoarchaeota archaeon]|nr:hypothetical protein [Nanoarchaeota archaeon]